MQQSIVNIVNEHDEVIGTKARDRLSPQDIIRIAVLWIEDGNGNVLLQQRSNGKIHGGLWAPAVAGTVEAHETYESNIIKEADEELGLQNIEILPLKKIFFKESPDTFGRMMMYFTCTISQDTILTLQNEEVSHTKWLPKQQAIEDAQRHLEHYVPSAVFWPELFA